MQKQRLDDELTTEQMLETWCKQWALEFLNNKVFPKAREMLENNVFIHLLEKWYKVYHYNSEVVASYIYRSIRNGKEDYEPYYDTHQQEYNEILFNLFNEIK